MARRNTHPIAAITCIVILGASGVGRASVTGITTVSQSSRTHEAGKQDKDIIVEPPIIVKDPKPKPKK